MNKIKEICEIKGLPVYYEQYGEGKPVFCIHGWSLDHRMMSECLEPVFCQIKGYRRIYIDLPGMGKTPSAKWIKNSDNTLEILIEFIHKVIGDENFLLVGESYGGHLAMGLINELNKMIDGVFLLCAMVASSEIVFKPEKLPQKEILRRSKQLGSENDNADIKSFLDFAVIATPEKFEKYKNAILSGVKIHDKEFLSNYYNGDFNPEYEGKLRSIAFNKPSCILTGRQDHCVGYLSAYEILERFPRATFAVLDCAGHNLQIDNEPVFIQMVKDWIWRVELREENYV